jgi:hypothetical protein
MKLSLLLQFSLVVIRSPWKTLATSLSENKYCGFDGVGLRIALISLKMFSAA